MTPHWHDGPLATLDWDGLSPVIWRAADAGRGERQRLARTLVARLAGVCQADVTLTRTPAGAPQIDYPGGWHIGLSRRGGQCLIGAATRPIAVDREVIDDAPPLWDMLTPAEICDLKALDDGEQPRAWLRRWTIKEAHAKLVGDPRRLTPEAIATQVIDATHATASCEGVSHAWTRDDGMAIETAVLWANA